MQFAEGISEDLRVLPCLSGMRDEDLTAIGQMASVKKVPKNSPLFSEADPIRFFFIVKEGAVKLYKTSPEGRELIVRIMGPGDYFCCAPLFSTGKHYVNSQTTEDSTLIVIPADDFKAVLSGGINEMGLRMIAGLCTRIRFLSTLVEDLTFRDVEQRVIMALSRLSEERPSNETIVSFSLTHQDIASMTGTVREVVSRAMSKLKREGVITDTSVRGFSIDRERLRRHIGGKAPSPFTGL